MNGKGSHRRQYDKKLDEAYKAGHPEVFGEHQKVDGRRTRIVIRDGRLMEKNLNRDVFAIDPATIPATYYEHRNWLMDRASGR